ncbi:MAG: carboxylate--amine ligase [Caldisphaera sp.]|uniref:ARMT1-like domain-containing protein n=2 Tax=Caldisphaera sp. TaxID=2060322 RepID=UPI000CBC64C4|nr:MAG: carboxylate--amine ligase [Caldisphaera sp.]
MIDKRCKLCLIESRVNDLIKLGNDDKIPELLEEISRNLKTNKNRDELFVDTFNYIKKLVKNDDPYNYIKNYLNEIGKKASLLIKEKLIKNNWDINLALKFSAAANIIDSNVLGYEPIDINKALYDEPKIFGEIKIPKNETIYLVLDNSGEVYIDLLLKETLIKNGYKVKTVMRKESYEIDVSMNNEILPDIVVDGNYSPLKSINNGFLIAKGIANLEAYLFSNHTLSTLHLFRAKCFVLADKFNVAKNTPIIINGEDLLKIFKI